MCKKCPYCHDKRWCGSLNDMHRLDPYVQEVCDNCIKSNES